jgi:hypothetical protein
MKPDGTDKKQITDFGDRPVPVASVEASFLRERYF